MNHDRARTDFAAMLDRNRRRMDAERREFARRTVAIVERHVAGRETFDALAYTLTMRDLELLLAEFYGRWPGDEQGRFWRLMLAECRAARALAFRRAVEDVRRRVQGERGLLRAIQRGA